MNETAALDAIIRITPYAGQIAWPLAYIYTVVPSVLILCATLIITTLLHEAFLTWRVSMSRKR